MRKAFVFFLALLILSSASAIAVGVIVYDESDDVEYRETVIYGDRAAADGIEVTLKSTLDNHHLWTTSIDFSSDSMDFDTDYYYTHSRYNDSVPVSDQIEIYHYFDVGYNIREGEETRVSKFRQAMNEFHASVGVGEEKSKIFYMKEYFDYYPISARIVIGGENYMLDSAHFMSEEESALEEALNNFFKIPILEGEAIAVTFENYHNGSSMGSGTAGSECASLWAASASSDDALYFTINCQTDLFDENGNHKGNGRIDTSQIPGGFGIYMLPHYKDDEGKVHLSYEKLANVYPLSESVYIEGMEISSDKKYMYLLTSENGEGYLTVIALDGMKEIETAKLTEAGEHLSKLIVHDGFASLVYFFEKNEEKRLMLFEEKSEGGLESVLDISLAPIFEIESESGKYVGFSEAVIWDGETLVVAEGDLRYPINTGFWLLTATADGVTYYGKYEGSLSVGENQNYRQSCRLVNNTPISIEKK